jgi:hypothetical protein
VVSGFSDGFSETGLKPVQQHFAKRSVRRRLIALAAAYAIALASLLSSFGAARAAAAQASVPGGVICHTLFNGAAEPSPASSDNNALCADCCCVGCLMLLAALPPAPTQFAAAPQSAGQRIALPATAVLVVAPDTTSHRSRAPPVTA